MADIDTEALATLEQVSGRIEEDELTPQMEVMILNFILDASDQARHYGNPKWTSDTCPPAVSRIVAGAVARHMANPAGYSQSRAADETLGWQDRLNPGELRLSQDEIERIEAIADPAGGVGGNAFGTMQMVAGIASRGPGWSVYVPVAGGIAEPFPFNAVTPEDRLPCGYWR